MNFFNCYQDISRADAYATLEFANAYYLAYRDLPAVIGKHVMGSTALDFGCGTGRSTRFLRDLGFAVSGVDISEEMLRIARSSGPSNPCKYFLDFLIVRQRTIWPSQSPNIADQIIPLLML